MATKCPKCHTDNPDTLKFCGECGTQIKKTEAQPLPTQTIEVPREELTTGSTFANKYQIIEEVGKGGMGRVYKALDTEIKEKVALKLIKPEIAVDKKTIERFQNELKYARKISHRNICRMYDLNKEGHNYYISMEYVEGEDLKSMIRMMGQLSTGKALSIAKQVCEGLAEAHSLDVVHRDLKPSNIMIDKGGNAKIMDFGIARSLKAKGITGTGVMIGTPEYMSPEQVEGKEADQRSDIYSLGVILYEMVTGRVPFEGETAFSIALKHKSEMPRDPSEINDQIGEDLSSTVLKCMEKNKEKRYQSVEELFSDLTKIEEKIPTTQRVIPEKKPFTAREITVKFSMRKFYIPALVLFALIVVISLSVIVIRKLPSEKPILPSHRQLTFTGKAFSPSISPDGKFIAYVDVEDPDIAKLNIYDLLSDQTLEIYRAERIYNLTWTPDGSEITLNIEQDSSPKSVSISRLGGSPRQLEWSMFKSWSPDGSQSANASSGSKTLRIINKSTGDSSSLTLDGPIKFVWDIGWSPKGDLLLVQTHNENNQNVIWTARTDGNNQNKVIEVSDNLSSPRWSPKGDSIYYLLGKAQLNEIWKIPVSSASGKPTKSPYLIISGFNFGGDFTLSNDGKYLAYTRRLDYSNLIFAEIRGKGSNRKVETKQLTTGTMTHYAPSISPDGTQIAFSKGDSQKSNIYVMSIDGKSINQITFLNSNNVNPVWSPDGKWIAFGSDEGGSNKVWKVSSQGGRPVQFANSALSISGGIVWDPKPFILYQKEGNRNFIILNPDTEEEESIVEDESVGWIFSPIYSPDGKQIAVYWNRKPEYGIWIISLEDLSHQFLYEGYCYPLEWSNYGNWIHFYNRDTKKYLKIEIESKKVEELLVLPFTIEGRSFYKTLNEKPDIFVNYRTLSDLWLLENFDPEIK